MDSTSLLAFGNDSGFHLDVDIGTIDGGLGIGSVAGVAIVHVASGEENCKFQVEIAV